MNWTVPRAWVGETAALLGSGPSMSAEVAAKVKGRCRVIAINDQFTIAPWADVLFAADSVWWRVKEWSVAKFQGLKVARGYRAPISGVEYLLNGGKFGVDERPTHVRGINSGQMAMNLAYHFGAKRILLCGFDCHGGRWFGDHAMPLSNTHRYRLWMQQFELYAPFYERKDVEVLNCTPNSALTAFKVVELSEALG